VNTPPFDAKKFLRSLSHRPGVYRMLDAAGEVLYVGKAHDLKKRVATYFGSKAHHPKTQALMSHTQRVEVTVTGTEQEALLLEYNLIKTHYPRFNILLRDGKSYPYIYVSSEQSFPRFEFYRGSRKAKGRFFGPFPSSGAVRQTMHQLQKLFQVRQCRDSFFANRSRPCLQYQIKRCSAPCVALVDAPDYQRDVDNAVLFLEGKNNDVLKDLARRMDDAAESRDYEEAAGYRDQISAIKSIQAQQVISGAVKKDTDVLALFSDRGVSCVAVIMIRGGRVLGSRNFFPKAAVEPEPGEILAAFIVQHYFTQTPPPDILVNQRVDDEALLEEALTERSGRPVAIRERVRGDRRRWIEMALNNARQGVALRRAANSGLNRQLESLADVLGLDEPPARLECFDISHTAGEEAMASCVVFGPEGPIKSDYRRFRIREASGGDDCASIAEAVRRRYTRIKKGEAPLPDLLLIDGGKGQVKAAADALDDLQLADVELFGVAKGQGRKPGREKIYPRGEREPLEVPRDSAALHLIQQIRDEAHRFAITGHRQRRSLVRNTSTLESINGLGPAKRRALLRQFGGLQGVKRAGIDDLTAVHGISRPLAERIFDHLHGGSIE
jgi:excinuclease ABC subunit C